MCAPLLFSLLDVVVTGHHSLCLDSVGRVICVSLIMNREMTYLVYMWRITNMYYGILSSIMRERGVAAAEGQHASLGRAEDKAKIERRKASSHRMLTVLLYHVGHLCAWWGRAIVSAAM